MSDQAHSGDRKRRSGAAQHGDGRQRGDVAQACLGDRVGDMLSLLKLVVERDIVPNLITANRVIGAADHGAWQSGHGTGADRESSKDAGKEPSTRSQASGAWHDSGFNAERADRDIRFSSGHIRMVDVARFVRLLRATGSDAAPAFVEVLIARGIPRTELYLDLLGPAATMIGNLWQDDECSFAEVTMVIARLHQILNALRGEHADDGRIGKLPSMLLTAAPGEQHSFAVAVVEAVFVEAGWQTRLSYTNDANEIIDLASRTEFDAIGLSLSNFELADILRATIMRLRSASANRDVVILVGGLAFQTFPDLCAHVGADATVQNGVEGAFRAQELLPRNRSLYA